MSAQDRAERAVAVAVAMEDRIAAGLNVSAAVAAVCDEHGVSPSYVYKVRARISGVPPRNWLPALWPNYKAGGRAAAISDAAWHHLWSQMRVAHTPLAAAYRATAIIAAQEGWAWPSYHTIRKRWLALQGERR